MDRLKDRVGGLAGEPLAGYPSAHGQPEHGIPPWHQFVQPTHSVLAALRQDERRRPILAAKRRRQLHPFFFRMGPVTLSICSVLLIALMAVLYLSQLGQAVTTNQRMADFRQQQAVLQRENQDLVNTIAQEESPTYIAAHARSMGLVPADPKTIQVLIIQHLRTIANDDQDMQP